MIRLGRWWLRHRRWWWLHRLAHHGSGACLFCRAVWAEFLSDPKAVASMKRGMADHEAGRWYHYDTETGESTPNPDWPKDGPQPGDELVSESQKHSDSAGSPVDAARRRGEM